MIWNESNSKELIQEIHHNIWRIIEDQSRSTTRKLVDTFEEHEVLENLIEQSKPTLKIYDDQQYFDRLHYLLWTPFRYPPLQWGSRFGSKLERSLLYASFDEMTALSEVAFYRLSFLNASDGNIGRKSTLYTSFVINVKSDKFIDLCLNPFEKHADKISSKTDYKASQKLGKDMREAGIECFKYRSARSPHGGCNIGVFTPKCLKNNNHLEKTFKNIGCFYTKDLVEFTYHHKTDHPVVKFDLETFLVDGKLPTPVE